MQIGCSRWTCYRLWCVMDALEDTLPMRSLPKKWETYLHSSGQSRALNSLHSSKVYRVKLSPVLDREFEIDSRWKIRRVRTWKTPFAPARSPVEEVKSAPIKRDAQNRILPIFVQVYTFTWLHVKWQMQLIVTTSNDKHVMYAAWTATSLTL